MTPRPPTPGPATACVAAGTALALALAACVPVTPPRAAAFDPDTVPEAHARPTGALMWPLASRAFLVTPEGDLDDGEWRVRFEPAAGGVPAGPPRAIAAEDRWLPVLRWNRHAGAVRFEFEAVAFPESAPRDTGLLVSLAVRAVNTGATPAEARLAARLGPRAPGAPFVAPDAPESSTVRPRWAARGGTGEEHAWSDLAADAEGVAGVWTLGPGDDRTARFVLSAYPAAAGALAERARAPHRARVAAARRYWQGELERATVLEVGDPELERAWRAARVVLLACAERRGGVQVPIGNPFQYRDVWLRDGARALRALAVAGHSRAARDLADGLHLFQWPAGVFLSQRGQLDGTGQVLWAWEEVLSRPPVHEERVERAREQQRLARACDAGLAAWRWCETQRAIGARSGWEYGALLPFGEPRDGELVRAQLAGNDAWALAGYEALARLLRSAGRASDAESVAASRARYLADFRAALARTGRDDVPPSWQGTGRDWGNLAVVWPCRVLPAADPRNTVLAERAWGPGGAAIPGWYGDHDSLHTYVGVDLAHWALLAGRSADARRVLDSLLHWRTASGGAGEIVSRSAREFGRNLPPHATAAAALVSLVRDMLVADDGDTLRLTLGAREAWWRGGTLRRAPTRFGVVDLRFARDGDAATWSWTPVEAWTVLTLPPGTRLGAPPAAPLVAGSAPGTVLAPPRTGEARVSLAAADR